jgi:GNAT superfamily N-acetyltransferase
MINVRRYQAGDKNILARLFTDTVHAISAADYSLEQVEVWAGDAPDLECWLGHLAGRMVLVAEHGSEIVGFTTFEANGHLNHLYVHHRFQRRGAASALLRQIEVEAASRGIRCIFTEASITARPFFEHIGFRVIAPQSVEVKGISFLNYRMEKFLA